MRVLVTGASGFVGRWTLRPLRELGFEVHTAGRRRPGEWDGLYHFSDLLEPGGPDLLVGKVKPTHLLHCAWEVAHGRFWEAPENLDWATATLCLARAFARHGGKRFVGIGTCAEYDWTDAAASPRRESDRLAPNSLYGQAKASTGALLEVFFSGRAIEFAWARLFHLFGPDEPQDQLVASLARSLLAGEQGACSSGHLVRDFMPVEAAGSALAMLVASNALGAMNIGSGRATTVQEIARMLGDLVGRPELIAIGARQDPADTPLTMLPDLSRMRHEVGAILMPDLRSALAATLEFWRSRCPAPSRRSP